MTNPVTVDPSADPALAELLAQWRQAPRPEQERLYATEIGPRLAPLFAALPLHGASDPERPQLRGLVSVLGFSWQPAALLAAWCRPEHMLLIGTRDSLAVKVDGRRVLDLIAAVSGVPLARIEHRALSDDRLELELYREVRSFVERHRFAPREVAVDPTAGKKSMSAAAALGGYLEGARLLYLDYAEYDAEKRVPCAGTEYPRLLANPLEVFGDLERERICAAFDRGDYGAAQELAEALALRADNPREAQALSRVAQGYGRWDEFRFRAAHRALREVRQHLERWGHGWSWAPCVRAALAEQLEPLEQLAVLEEKASGEDGDAARPDTLAGGLPLLCTYLVTIERHLRQGRATTALLLTYAVIERLADLVAEVECGLNDERPDPEKFEAALPVGSPQRERFHACGRKLVKGSYDETRFPPAQITYFVGVQLLAALHPEWFPASKKVFSWLRGIMGSRNKCPYQHGFNAKPVAPEEVRNYYEVALALVTRAGESAQHDVARSVASLAYPRLSER